jgi:orotate phosphoribosyltransferase
MNFRSIAQLSDQLISWSKELPHDIDAVVGIPRSGLLAASILALYRNVPFTDVDGLLEGRCLSTGRRENALNAMGDGAALRFLDEPRRILVLDDSIRTGTALSEVRSQIEFADLPHKIIYGAVYATPGAASIPDVYCEILPDPRMFEWNVLHHPKLEEACLDMDGVLCADPRREENDDGKRYRRFLLEARPLHCPRARIGYIVTNRLEKYRPETKAWLAKQGIEYGDLIMMDYPDAETRRRMGTCSEHKARVYRNVKASIFIESDLKQAIEISKLARKEVICVDTMQLVRPDAKPAGRFRHYDIEDVQEPSMSRRLARRVVPKSIRYRIHSARRTLSSVED